jgi:tyrosyl-tRNA synthetase
MNGWKKQAAQLIDFEGENPVKFEQNNRWLSKLNLEDILNLMSNVTVQQMLERDLFAKRLEENISIGLHEFMYPLMQGYDGVAMEVDMEIGGTDQTFNMLMGRQLSKAYLGKEKFVRTNKMMEAPEGRTMSKTRGNGINLSDSPEEIYGKAMSYPDEYITKGLELLTEVPLEKIKEVKVLLGKGENPLQFKKLMAFEIVKTIKGEKAAKKAESHFEKVVQEQEIPKEIPEIRVTSGKPIYQNVKKMAPKLSNSQIKRIIKQGGLTINDEKLTDPFSEVQLKPGDIIKLGKRRYAKIK